jgi:hypothetical protein
LDLALELLVFVVTKAKSTRRNSNPRTATSFELLHGKQPDMTALKTLFYRAYVLDYNPDDNISSRAREGVLLGTDRNAPGVYLVRMDDTGRVIRTRSVTCDELTFPFLETTAARHVHMVAGGVADRRRELAAAPRQRPAYRGTADGARRAKSADVPAVAAERCHA